MPIRHEVYQNHRTTKHCELSVCLHTAWVETQRCGLGLTLLCWSLCMACAQALLKDFNNSVSNCTIHHCLNAQIRLKELKRILILFIEVWFRLRPICQAAGALWTLLMCPGWAFLVLSASIVGYITQLTSLSSVMGIIVSG